MINILFIFLQLKAKISFQVYLEILNEFELM